MVGLASGSESDDHATEIEAGPREDGNPNPGDRTAPAERLAGVVDLGRSALDSWPVLDYTGGVSMQPFHALVKNGRLTLDEPSDLPEGQVVVLLPLEELLSLADDVADAEDAVTFTFPPASSTAPRWKKPKRVDAAAIIDELRSL